MARTTIVKAARKQQPGCMSPRCTHESRDINVGDSYKWFAIRSHRGGRGTRKQYHVDCFIPQSHRTTSAQLGMIYDAQETASEALSNINREQDASDIVDDLRSIAEEAASQIREAGEMYQESADNMESGFGTSTSISEELAEKAQALDSWADDLDSVDIDDFDGGDDEEFDEDAAREQAEIEVAEKWFALKVDDSPYVESGYIDDEGMTTIKRDEILTYVIADNNAVDTDGTVLGESGFERKVDEIVEAERSEHEAQLDDGKKDEWIDEQVQKVEDALNESPL